jgi:NADPH:quinone reductase-like Zn-dependent oxidoreductase
MPVDELTLIGKRATVRGFFAGHYDYATKVLPVIREAAPLVASGALFVPVAAVFDLEDIHAAIRQLERGGKVLLRVARSLGRTFGPATPSQARRRHDHHSHHPGQ